MEKMNMKQEREKMYQDFANEVDDRVQQNDILPPVNIIVAGVTGAGKSTLLNAVFGENFAETGQGAPVTAEIKMYEKDGYPVRIWDTCGFELDQQRNDATINDINDIIKDKDGKADKYDRIHALWYCVNAAGERFQEKEIKFIAGLKKNDYPFILVMTQCMAPKRNAKFEAKIREALNQNNLSNIPIMQVLAKETEVEIGDREETISAKGVDELVLYVTEKMPDYIKNGIIAAQQVSKTLKRQASTTEIEKYVEEAKHNVLDKIWIVNIPTVTHQIRGMFAVISQLYNTPLTREQLNEVIDYSTAEWKGEIATLLHPFRGKMPDELSSLISKMELDTPLANGKYGVGEKASLFIAITGFKFMDAIETVWDKSTREQVEDINVRVDLLRAELRKRFREG